jgi:cytoskeletal protein CcmA (bactofilin family)
MLGNKSSAGNTTIISRDTVVVGDLHFNGSLDVEGLVQGNIIALPGKDATVRVIERGRVEGEIRAPRVVVNGEVIGDVYSATHLELAPKARVSGNVYYTLVEMAVGAEVNGSLKHVDDPDKSQADRQAKIGVGGDAVLGNNTEKSQMKKKG